MELHAPNAGIHVSIQLAVTNNVKASDRAPDTRDGCHGACSCRLAVVGPYASNTHTYVSVKLAVPNDVMASDK